MALEIKGLQRIFKMKKNSTEMELADPDSNMSPSEVMDFYSMTYPELTTLPCTGRNGRMTGRFTGSRQPSGQKDRDMAKIKRNNQKKETCRLLPKSLTANLAGLIIREAGSSNVSRGVTSRKRRRLPPAESVMLF